MKIKSIKKVTPRMVYAIQTSTHTFITNGLAHHNCYHCNMGLRGNYPAYTLEMLDLHGRKWVDEMLNLKNELKKYSQQDYIDIKAKYELKTAELLKQLA